MAAENRADAFLRMIRRSQRGHLKVYLGYAAGVGKTYRMLQEAHQLKDEGIDVVVALVETHGRADIDRLLEGLEVIPRRREEYRGIMVEEMDVDAVTARKPQIALVDELAHANVPGSRNAKRYQDVQDILARGIHVITTLNIQHLESLYDIVERTSGVKVLERIPDSVLADADQIVNVDLTTEDLEERLREGKVYPLERVETAMSNFFRKTNLGQLRELTLRELASQIDLRSRDDLEEDISATPDQIMVCLSSRGPNSEKLLRYASRLAGRLNRNWYAVYVQTPAEEPTAIDAHVQRLLASTLTLAKQLGAIIFTFKGEDIVKTILQFAKEYRVGHIVIGSPGHIPVWKRLTGRKSVTERLVRDARNITVVVLDTAETERTAISPIEEQVIQEGIQRSFPQENHLSFRDVLTPDNILIMNESVSREDVIRRLTGHIQCNGEVVAREKVLAAVIEREEQGSTFLNEGIAFPHARIDGLKRSCIVVGITHGGVITPATDKRIECVFLILTPTAAPDEQTRLLSLLSRASHDKQLMNALRSVQRPDDVLTAFQNWEGSQ
jgi:two-component system, OmpR family, sensor histidine kinase KdpD